MKPIALLKKYEYDIVLLIFLIIIGLKYIYGVSHYTSILLYDESIYLHNGLYLFKKEFPNLNFSPLYAIYLFILSIFQHDPIKLYYLNYIILTAMMPVLAYIYFRMFNIKRIPAFLLSTILLISHANYAILPKVSLFALYLIFLSTVFITYMDSTELKLLTACISLFIVSFARPEFMVSSMLLFLIFFFYSIICGLKYKQYRCLKMCLGLLTSIIILYFAMGGLPMISKGAGERSFIAFGQHFASNVVMANGSKIDPWTNWERIVSAYFGSAKTVKQALINNPVIFFLHIKQNIIFFPYNLMYLLGCQFNLILHFKSNYWATISLILILSLGLSNSISRLSFKSMILSVKNIKINTIILLMLIFLASIPSFVSSVLIMPKPCYLLPLVMMILTVIGIFLSSITLERSNLAIYIAYGIIFLIIVPCLSKYEPMRYLETNDIIQTIQDLHIKKTVNLLDIDGGYSLYQTPNFHWIIAMTKNTDFDTFIKSKKINMIVVSNRLIQNLKYSPDKEFNDFLAHFSKYDFTKIDFSASEKYILLKKSLQ